MSSETPQGMLQKNGGSLRQASCNGEVIFLEAVQLFSLYTDELKEEKATNYLRDDIVMTRKILEQTSAWPQTL